MQISLVHIQKRGRRRKRNNTRKRRSLRKRKRAQHSRTSRRIKRKHSRRKRGGVGFRLDLSKCPPGGLPDPLQYQTNASDFY